MYKSYLTLFRWHRNLKWSCDNKIYDRRGKYNPSHPKPVVKLRTDFENRNVSEFQMEDQCLMRGSQEQVRDGQSVYRNHGEANTGPLYTPTLPLSGKVPTSFYKAQLKHIKCLLNITPNDLSTHTVNEGFGKVLLYMINSIWRTTSLKQEEIAVCESMSRVNEYWITAYYRANLL